jgi:hypothetical protein
VLILQLWLAAVSAKAISASPLHRYSALLPALRSYAAKAWSIVASIWGAWREGAAMSSGKLLELGDLAGDPASVVDGLRGSVPTQVRHVPLAGIGLERVRRGCIASYGCWRGRPDVRCPRSGSLRSTAVRRLW